MAKHAETKSIMYNIIGGPTKTEMKAENKGPVNWCINGHETLSLYTDSCRIW